MPVSHSQARLVLNQLNFSYAPDFTSQTLGKSTGFLQVGSERVKLPFRKGQTSVPKGSNVVKTGRSGFPVPDRSNFRYPGGNVFAS